MDNLLQVRHPTATPILDLLRLEQAHVDQDIGRGYGLATSEQLLHGAYDSRAEGIVAERLDADGSVCASALFLHHSPLYATATDAGANHSHQMITPHTQ